ncbi:MAG: thermonuclease family protein [Candidatus Aenigmatarchaeota archaeon]
MKSIYLDAGEEYILVIDGDTIELKNGERIRLLDIDAPEASEPFYQEATLALREMVEGGKIVLEKDPFLERDKYGRLLRYVFSDGKLVNCELVRLGFAKNVGRENSKYYNCLQKAEQEARERKIGIWSSS